MKAYLNIDKHPLHKGRYIGYSNGAWRITKRSHGWSALKDDQYFFCKTLAEVSAELTKRGI